MSADHRHESGSGASSGTEPLACVMCRSRKLKCDRTKPSCARCLKVDAECVYPESRRKPTFKRRNVKEIEARLAQVESYLKEVNKSVDDIPVEAEKSSESQPFIFNSAPNSNDADSQEAKNDGGSFGAFPDYSKEANFQGNGQLMGLGYSETLPPQEVQEELNNTFFMIAYHFIPIVHSGRYYQSFYSGPLRKPPMTLQYAIWAMAANDHAKYGQYAQVFYKRARQYVEADEMKAHGEHFITIAHAQALCLIAAFEAKSMLFTRASTNCAKAVRLCQMMGLDRLDGSRDDLPPALGPTTSWEELEERRRVFWGAFSIDSHASISTGWPALINPADITTRLPSSEESFQSGKEEQSPFLEGAFQGAKYSGFAGTIVVCYIFRLVLKHIHRPKPSDRPDDMMDGPFWKRHRELDNQLSSAFMFLPARFRLPLALRDPGAIHLNLNLHAAVIILHHAALEMADTHNLPASVVDTSLCRLRASAEEIVNIIRMSSHSTAIFRSPLCALSLYCTTTVYVYMAKRDQTSPLSSVDKSNLEIIIQAMEAIGRNHEITTSFLQQACLDIERNGLASVLKFPTLDKYRNIFGGPENSHIPFITRSSVSKHAGVPPVLPGRLPLNSPKGKILPSHLKMSKFDPVLVDRGSGPVVKELINADCFQPVLGAVTRNVGGGPLDRTLHEHHQQQQQPQTNSVNTRISGVDPASILSNVTGVDLRNPLGDTSFVLPDRTNSSASSPPYRPSGSDLLSGSSHTSPGIGLGNTQEENRIDLRALQERMMTQQQQLWQTAQFQSVQDSMFTPQLSEAVFQMLGVEETNMTWESFNESMTWQSDMPNV